MKIVADENIPLLNAFFTDIAQGDIKSLAGRDITQKDLVNTDILLVRSITKVNAALLKGTSVKFVGTCTIGTDHLDIPYLQAQGIQYANAPGCNAQGVVEYVLSVLITLGERRQCAWQSLSVGIVGAGNVGGRLYETLKKLGLKVCAYDPNVAAFNSASHSQQVWQQDVVTLHTPISKEGEFKTHHLVDAQRLNAMQSNACLINSCRGAVIDNDALLKHLQQHPQFLAVLDVWEQEPAPSDELIEACFLATPHIAGYSLDGKYKGTSMIYDALCEFLALPKRIHLAQLMAQAPIRKISISPELDAAYVFNKVVRSAYDVRDDHFRMLSLLGFDDKHKAKEFDVLRKCYPLRRDANHMMVSGKIIPEPKWLQALGVKLKTS